MSNVEVDGVYIMQIFKLYCIGLVIFLALDALWLGVIAKSLYQKELAHLMGNVRFSSAALFYFIYLFGIIYFCLFPAIASHSAVKALVNGAFFGFVCYATYDLTNFATLKGWPLKIVIYDLSWGTFITGFTSFATYCMGKWWKVF